MKSGSATASTLSWFTVAVICGSFLLGFATPYFEETNMVVLGEQPKVVPEQEKLGPTPENNNVNNEVDQPPPTQDDDIGCPDKVETSDSIKEAQALLGEARSILTAAKRQRFAQQSAIARARIAVWRKTKDVWKRRNDSLVSSCFMLLGADGTEVFPEIPKALNSLKQGSEWLDASMSYAESGKLKLSGRYLKRARTEFSQARNTLDGTSKRRKSHRGC